MVRFLGFVVALGLMGCGGGDDQGPDIESMPNDGRTETVCEAGRVAECPCGNEATATQTCKADGSGWGECGCVDPQELVPQELCTGNVDPTVVVAMELEQCPKERPRWYKTCASAIVQAKKCTPNGPYFCCPTY